MLEIFKRVSIRNFSDRKVEAEKIRKLLEAGMAAPSAGNQKEWEFIVVTEQTLLDRLAMASPNSRHTAKAPLAIVLLGNMRNMKYPPYWEQDLGACAQNILLEAVHLDLGGVWLGIAPLEDRMMNITNIFSLPSHITPFAIIALGYPQGYVAPKERYDPGKVHYNGYRMH